VTEEKERRSIGIMTEAAGQHNITEKQKEETKATNSSKPIPGSLGGAAETADAVTE
jgi:hypothetical protein